MKDNNLLDRRGLISILRSVLGVGACIFIMGNEALCQNRVSINQRKSNQYAALVTQFYKTHFSHEMDFSEENIRPLSRWFSQELLHLIQHELRKPKSANIAPKIDGDIFTDSQDHPSKFKIGKIVVAERSADIKVHFSGNGIKKWVIVRVINVKDGLKIDDLFYEEDKSLKELLRE